VLAPISGRAGAVPVKEGNIAKENDTTLVTLLQTSPVYVTFSVPENALAQIRQFTARQPLTVTAAPANGLPTDGVLRFIDSAVDNTTGTIKLKATFNNSARNLWPGQFVNVRARLNLEHDRILVPAQTVQTGPNGKYVWLMKADHTVTMQPVEVLRNYTEPGSPELAVVGSGLQAGDNVVLEGQSHLMPGARVRVMSS
jgi:multidrug efflux system membrane fusion protein